MDLEVASLTSLCQQRDVQLIRMDVEGAGLEAIGGGRDLLGERNITIVMEWIPRTADRKRSIGLYNSPKSLGYWVYRISSNGLVRIESGQDLHSGHKEIWQAGECDLLRCKENLGIQLARW